MQYGFDTQDLLTIAPELLMAVAAMGILMLGAFSRAGSMSVSGWLANCTLLIAALLVLFTSTGRVTAFANGFVVDDFARFMKLLVVLGSVAAIVMSGNFLREERFEKFEFPILIMLAALGMMMMISANDLISLYMGLELQSLSLYVIAAINRDSARSSEAGLKYFVLGALSSGMLLYGASLIYGFVGTTSFEGIASAINARGAGLGVTFGLVFILAGLAFKISAVPFHMWTPDVYEGAPTPVTAFFAAAPKVAAMALFLRVAAVPFFDITVQWQQIVSFVAIASMALGAFAAIGQTNIKRLLAYSSIGHMGFALVGLAAGNQEGISGVVIYMTIYLVMTLGTFACVLAMRTRDGAVEEINDLSGLARNDPYMALMLALFMFSLAGIPPLAGFFAKFYVFLAAIKSGLYMLAVLGVLASVVGAYYYLRVVKIMYFDEPGEKFVESPGSLRVIMGLAAIIVVFFFAYPQPLVSAAAAAAASLF